jgi:hypothetical protein
MLRKTLGALAVLALVSAPAAASTKVLCRNGEVIRSHRTTCHSRGGVSEVKLPHHHWWQVRAPRARCRDGSTDRGRSHICMNHGGVRKFL